MRDIKGQFKKGHAGYWKGKKRLGEFIGGRPKKYPTSVVRIDASLLDRIQKDAKRKRMTVPDYMQWRLNR